MEKNRLIFTAILMIIVSFTLTTIISISSLKSVITEDEQEVSKLLASRIHDTISNDILKPITVSQAMAQNYFFIEDIKNEHLRSEKENELIYGKYLESIKNKFKYESVFFVSDSSKRYYTYKGLNKIIDLENDSHDVWYKYFLDSNKPYDLDVDVDQVNKDAWTVFVNTRICDENGKLLGVCGVGVLMTNIQSIFSKYENEFNVKVNLVNAEGLVQVDTDEINIENSVLDATQNISDKSKEFLYMAGEKKGSFRIVKYIEDFNWYLVVTSEEQPKSQVSYLIILNVISLVVVILILSIAFKIIIYRENRLKLASETDKMTNLYNRRAFEIYMKELREKNDFSNLSVVVFDVNGLKNTNDTLGHDAGDELIIAASDIISEISEPYGHSFRIGGDEFILVSEKDIDFPVFKAAIKEKASQWSGKLIQSLSLSLGYSKGDSTIEEINQIIRQADKEMYKDKEEFYKNCEFDRRRR